MEYCVSTAKTSLDKAVTEAIKEISLYPNITEDILMCRILKPMKSYYSHDYYKNCAEMEIEDRICPAFGLDVDKTLAEYKNCDPGHITIASLFYYANTECGYRLPQDIDIMSIDPDSFLFNPKSGDIINIGAFTKDRDHWNLLPYKKSKKNEQSKSPPLPKLGSYLIPYNNFKKTISKDFREKVAYGLVNGDIRKIGSASYIPSERNRLIPNPSGYYTLNTYQPPVIDHTLFDRKLVEEFLIHVEHIVGANHIDYFLKWMAITVLQPWVKYPHAVLITGHQGSGKTLIVKIMREVCGQDNFSKNTMESLSGSRSEFNKDLQECTLIHVEEVNDTHTGKRHHYYNHTFKDLISEPEIRIRGMRENGDTLPIYFNLIMTSNFRDALPIELNDRRVYCIHSKARDQKRGIETAIRWNDPQIMPSLVASVYCYLKSIDISNFIHLTMPKTDDRDSLMDAQSPVIQATRAVFEDLQESERYKKIRDKCYNAGLSGPCVTDYFLYTAVMEKIKEETSATGSIQSIADYYIKVTKDEEKKCIFTTAAIEEIKLTMGNLGAERTGNSKRITKGKYHVFFLSDSSNKDMSKIRHLLGEIDHFDPIKQFKEPGSSFDNVMRFEKK